MERKQVTVKEIIPAPDKWKDKLSKFMGADGITYDCWHKSIQPLLKVGAVLDIEFKVEEKNGYQHHEIVQAYDKGQAVLGQKQQLGGGGFRSKSPEEIAIERQSIEEQVAFKGAAELLIVDKCPKELQKPAILWAVKKLGGIMSDKEAAALFEKPPAAKPAEKPAEPIKETAKAETAQVSQPIDNGMYGFVDCSFIDDALKDPKVKRAWPASKMMEWLRERKAGATTIQAGVAKLNEADAAAFCKELEDRKKMA